MRQRLQKDRLPIRRLLQQVVLHFLPPASSPYPPPLLKERRQFLRYRLLQWQQHTQQQLLRPWPPRLFSSPSSFRAVTNSLAPRNSPQENNDAEAGSSGQPQCHEEQQHKHQQGSPVEQQQQQRLHQQQSLQHQQQPHQHEQQQHQQEQQSPHHHHHQQQQEQRPREQESVEQQQQQQQQMRQQKQNEEQRFRHISSQTYRKGEEGMMGGVASTGPATAIESLGEGFTTADRQEGGAAVSITSTGDIQDRAVGSFSRRGGRKKLHRLPFQGRNPEMCFPYTSSSTTSSDSSSSSSQPRRHHCDRTFSYNDSSNSNKISHYHHSEESKHWRYDVLGRRHHDDSETGAREAACSFFLSNDMKKREIPARGGRFASVFPTKQQQCISDHLCFVPSHWLPPSLWPAQYQLPPAPPPPVSVGSRIPIAEATSVTTDADTSTSSLLYRHSTSANAASSPAKAASAPRASSLASPVKGGRAVGTGAAAEAASADGAAVNVIAFAHHAARAVDAYYTRNSASGAQTASTAAGSPSWGVHSAAINSTTDMISSASALRVHALGHGTFLLQCCGINVLTDPILSSHAGPWGCVGVPRVSQAAVSLESLPPIDAILISSLRYDAYDYTTVRQLCRRDGSTLFVPEGAYARRYFSPKVFGSVYPMQWGDRVKFEHLTVCFTPAIHASIGRYLWDHGVPGYGGFVLHWTSNIPNDRSQFVPEKNATFFTPHGVQTPETKDHTYGEGWAPEEKDVARRSGVRTPRHGVGASGTPAEHRLQGIAPNTTQWEDIYAEEQQQQQRKRLLQQESVTKQKTVYYAGRTAYSDRLFDMIRNAAARDRQQLAAQAAQEEEWKAQALQQHQEYIRRTASTQKLEELLLLPPASSDSHSTAFQGTPQQHEEQQQQQQRMQMSCSLQGQQDQQHQERQLASSFVEEGKEKFIFDLSILPIGGYEPRPYMQRYQMMPEEAVEAHLRLRSRVSVASHFDVFPVGSEPFGEAPERMRLYCKKRQISTTYADNIAPVKINYVSDTSASAGLPTTVVCSPIGPDALDESSGKHKMCKELMSTRLQIQGNSSTTCNSGRTSTDLSNNSSSVSTRTRCMETSARCVKSLVSESPAAEKRQINATAEAAGQRRGELTQDHATVRSGDADTACFRPGEQQNNNSNLVGENVKALEKQLDEEDKGCMRVLQPGEYFFIT